MNTITHDFGYSFNHANYPKSSQFSPYTWDCVTQNRLSLEAASQGRDFSQGTSYDLSSLTSCMDEAYYDLPEETLPRHWSLEVWGLGRKRYRCSFSAFQGIVGWIPWSVRVSCPKSCWRLSLQQLFWELGTLTRFIRWPVGQYLVELSRRYWQDSLTGVVTDQLDPHALQVYHWHWILSFVEENKCQHWGFFKLVYSLLISWYLVGFPKNIWFLITTLLRVA